MGVPPFCKKEIAMFYYRNWERFCAALQQSDFHLCTAEQSLQQAAGIRFVVLKHDVEACVARAHRLAEIEHRHGICGSYYVQAYLLRDPENVRLLQEMQSWGHEISYHYDVLDAHAGDYDAALEDFESNMQVFRDHGFHFRTICQHGNPVKNRVGYTSNRDFFRNPRIRSLYPDLVDMVVDYSQHTEHSYRYISDVSYRWNIITLPETNDLHPEVENQRIGGFDTLLALLSSSSSSSFIISTHPHRWRRSAVGIYAKIAVFRVVRAVVMTIRHLPGVSTLLNKFYFLAKKI